MTMADPEIPEVRAELQRGDRPEAAATYAGLGGRIGALKYLWAAFAVAVIAILAFVLLG
jgi:hypothetical protein